MSTAISIRPAVAADIAPARSLLLAASLHVEDLYREHFAGFLVATEAGAVVGLIGLETFSEFGLLRSLVVDPACRGQGLGQKLVAELEAVAGEQGVEELWLLTIDADAFFAKLGYTVSGRDGAPSVIANTAEFTSLCPVDAVLMKKSITVGRDQAGRLPA